jgi:hypothetical protein
MGKRSQHVIRNPKGGWSVFHSGATRASRNFDTQAEAVNYGRNLARREQTELYVHRNDGTIREKNSYGLDPHPPIDGR